MMKKAEAAIIPKGFDEKAALAYLTKLLNSGALTRKRNINPLVRKIMHDSGLTIEVLVKKHIQLLNAGYRTWGGKEITDNRIQMQALQEAYRLYQAYPIPEQKLKVEREETFHVSIEEKRLAEQALRECVDAEIVTENERSSDNRDQDGNGEARPLY
jgi:hypothetical protein